MAVTGADILQYASTVAGSAGGAISGSTITSGIPNNVWPNITDAERVAGIIVYRKTFWKNNNGVDSALVPVIYVPTPPVNASLVIGLGFNSADDDNPAQGNMTAWSAPAKVSLTSDGVDARVATVVGLDGAGLPISEDVPLTGLTEVLTAATFSKVHHTRLASTSGTRTVTVRQGTGGTTRGTIGPNEIVCWLWYAAASKGAGIALPNLAPAQTYGIWRRMTVAAGAGPVRPDTLQTRFEENA